MSNTPAPAPKLNFLETLLVGLISEAESVVPIFLHSKNAMAAFNVSEPIFNNVLATILAQQQAQQVAAVPPTEPTVTTTPALKS